MQVQAGFRLPRVAGGRVDSWAVRGWFPGYSGKFRELFWLHFGICFDDFFVFFVTSVFASMFYSFLKACLLIFGILLEVILVTFPGFAKNAAPHELSVNTNQIEGRAAAETSKKTFRNKEKNGMKTKTNK